MSIPHYTVVAAVVMHEGQILCVQKPKTRFEYTAFHWEYPGGKVEEGETEPEALVRELQEEMSYPIVVDRALCTVEHSYPDFAVSLRFWLCHPQDEEAPRQFVLREHNAYRWLTPEEIVSGQWCNEPDAFCAADYAPELLHALLSIAH